MDRKALERLAELFRKYKTVETEVDTNIDFNTQGGTITLNNEAMVVETEGKVVWVPLDRIRLIKFSNPR